MVEYSELKREIADTRAIIFAVKQSIKYAQNQEEYNIYIEEIAFREASLAELCALIVQ